MLGRTTLFFIEHVSRVKESQRRPECFGRLALIFRKSITDSEIRVGSFFLTPATALRYERHDRKVQQMTKEAELGLGKNRRRVDINEEYYRLAAKVSCGGNRGWEDFES